MFQVYHCEDDLLTTQKMNYVVGDNSLLCVLPDYCVCYKDANFLQTQVSQQIFDIEIMICGMIAYESTVQ